MRIIPAIDLIDGKCVRLTKGDYGTKKVYSENPLELAKQFEDFGIQYLHVVDLDGAKYGSPKNLKWIEEICSKTRLAVDAGGGLQSFAAIESCFNSGVSQINLGSVAFKKPDLFVYAIQQFGVDKIILGADVKDRSIRINGWLRDTEKEVVKYITEHEESGIKYVVCTDIDKDGALIGPSVDLYKELIENCPKLKLIASGGIRSTQDLDDLKQIGVEGAIVGKAIYEKKIELQALRKYVD